jgi:DNA-binding protein WhiA
VSLTETVRTELAALPARDSAAVRAELSGVLRFSGVLRRRGGPDEPWTWLSTLRSTAARRADRQLVALFSTRCQLRARRVTSPRPMLLVELEVPGTLLEPLGLRAADGKVPTWLRTDSLRWAYVRGVALAGLRLSAPGRPHCEIEAPNRTLAIELAALLSQVDVRAAAQHHTRDRWRVVAKSRTAIETLLAGTGATDTYLRWEEERTRRSVRGAAARGVNADRANAQRSVRAASQQVAMVADVMAHINLDELDEDLRATALARLANPTASLRELAGLLDVSRATVSRRLGRLATAAKSAPPASR